jgi:hypothetical protein
VPSYNNMTKAELVSRLNKIDNIDVETLAIAAVVAAIEPLAPTHWDQATSLANKRSRIARVFRHAAERHGVTL